MVVQHNLTAMNSNRMLGVTSSKQAKSSEKLSSGYKINRAADDAAGLSISEKMRKQINGLDRASTNAQDGVSAVQTAEGALTEVHSMLQRMNELAVQAANGTNSPDDRDAIQAEIEQLTTEIDRVAETTKFNETYLLKGADGTTRHYMVGHDAGLAGELTDRATDATFVMDALEAGDTYSIGGKEYTIGIASGDVAAKLTELGANATDSKITIEGVVYTVGDAADPTTNTDTFANIAAKATAGSTVKYGAETLEVFSGELVDGVDPANQSLISAEKAQTLIQEALTAANNVGVVNSENELAEVGTDNIDATDGKWTYEITKSYADVPNTLSFNLHVGTDADMTNKINVDIASMDAAGLGIKGLNVADDSGIAATYAIDAIADAIQVVSDQRSSLGAIQNRLEHTISNLDNVVENTTAAESRIRDTDMAEEMVEYSKNNILAQAGQSMLAQANQSTQGVLSLLQ